MLNELPTGDCMNPIKAGTKKSPTGQRLNVSLAFAENRRRWQRAAARINEVIKSLPAKKIIVDKSEAVKVTKQERRTKALRNHFADSRYIWANSEFNLKPKIIKAELSLFNNAVRYEYQVDADLMARTSQVIAQILKQDILDGLDFWTSRFWLSSYINEALEDGTVESIESAKLITAGTEASAAMALVNAEQQLNAPHYIDRMQLVNGRVFENMQGLTGDMKSQLRLTLTEGMARGVGTRDLTGMINKRLGVGMVRAERIARTEIHGAYNDAYMDESKELNKGALKDSVWEIKQAHRSALSPTTRPHHKARHGNIYTVQQQKDWWSVNGNKISCLCSTLDVLVNKKTGETLQQKMIDRMKREKKDGKLG